MGKSFKSNITLVFIVQYIKVTSVEYTAFIHATEDYGKVIKAIDNLIPPRLRERKNVIVEETYGHYDNPIRIVKISFRNPEYAHQALLWLWGRLSDIDKAYLMRNLDLHVDEKMKLYMRLDKQDAFLGFYRLSSGDDVIKVKFGFKGPKDAIRDFLKSL